jgi:hypothetical protein
MKCRSFTLRELNHRPIQDSGTIQPRSASNEGIKALVITCIDFRLIDDAVYYLNSKGYLNNYDEFILAGASLGYNTSLNGVNSQYSGWDKILENHIDISYTLHKIKEIIVIDHMDCGAYKAQLNGGNAFSKYEEINQHIKQLNNFNTTINNKYIKDDGSSKYDVKLWLMSLDGTVDINPTYWQPKTKIFNLAKNNIVVIGNKTLSSSFISVGFMDEPLSTISEKKYHLLNNKKNKIISSIMTLRSANQNGNAIWCIHLLQSVTGFLSNKLSRTKLYYVRLADSLAYVKVKLFASKNDSKIKCTIEKMDYF